MNLKIPANQLIVASTKTDTEPFPLLSKSDYQFKFFCAFHTKNPESKKFSTSSPCQTFNVCKNGIQIILTCHRKRFLRYLTAISHAFAYKTINKTFPAGIYYMTCIKNGGPLGNCVHEQKQFANTVSVRYIKK